MFRLIVITLLSATVLASCGEKESAITKAVKEGDWDTVKGTGAVRAKAMMTPEDHAFLQEVKEDWELRRTFDPASETEMLKKVGMEVTLENLVQTWTEPESLKDRAAAALVVMATPQSIDDKVYLADDFAYVRVRPWTVALYKSTARGLKTEIWVDAETLAEVQGNGRDPENPENTEDSESGPRD